MDTQAQQVVDRLKQATNILVTVSSNPSVDQLAACMGLTLALNKLGKHATAVFSGEIPSTMEFLQPEKTIEKNTDSLRDFIIALDKSKADKLRYKVEDKVVKIFITPYKTSISEKDLDFSQGDFNVDAVVALGVRSQSDLDAAITAHGRILHDATVISVNVRPGEELGSIKWLDPAVSSLAELVVVLVNALDKKALDGQIATALLTGIVAETDRFSNSKTSPQTMSVSAELMAAGANQQLIATRLTPVPEPIPIAVTPEPTKPETAPESTEEPPKPDDGALEISHDDQSSKATQPESDAAKNDQDTNKPEIRIDEHGSLTPSASDATPAEPKQENEPEVPAPPKEETQPEPAAPLALPEPPPAAPLREQGPPKLITEPPTISAPSSASGAPAGFGVEDQLTLPQVEPGGPLLQRSPLSTPPVGQTIMPPNSSGSAAPTAPASPVSPPATNEPFAPPVAPWQPPAEPSQPAGGAPSTPSPEETISEIERQVNSPHVNASGSTDASAPVAPDDAQSHITNARNAVDAAINGATDVAPEPIQALNAQNFGDSLHADPQASAPSGAVPAVNGTMPTVIESSNGPMLPPVDDNAFVNPSATDVAPDPNSPPPVPPPMLPPTYQQ